MEKTFDLHAEWLEADGWGGFASGTVSGIRTRRYHALLLSAATPPTGRQVLVNGIDVWVETENGRYALSSQRYAPEVVHPDGASRIVSFTQDPWPTWVYRLPDGTEIEQSLFIPNGQTKTVLTWRLLTPRPMAHLSVRPFLSGRDYHALHHENPAFRFDNVRSSEEVMWRPYPGLPRVTARSNGAYRQDPQWYRNFLYSEERDRGLDFMEDLASPGEFAWNLAQQEATLLFASGDIGPDVDVKQLRAAEERRRAAFATPLHRAADAYLVRRKSGRTIVAGYPWFTDWGRDTFIALRGLCLASGHAEVARQILLEWATVVSEGMLPNLFPDGGGTPEYNSVDASLWYVIAVHDVLSQADNVSSQDRAVLEKAVGEILDGYTRGTRFGIRQDRDGLLSCGVPGVQLTWMDAKVGDWVVTPRIGKPVEVQALWINALRIGGRLSEAERAQAAFEERFWNPVGYLYDVADVDHEAGRMDAAFRPNQIFAVGGLPFSILDGARAMAVVTAVESKLWTPLGLRSLAAGEAGYRPRYQGGVLERDGAYHQGTVWPWLIGPFIEAWLRVHGHTEESRDVARRRFVAPLLQHLQTAGLGHVSEIADAEAPHTPRGCPYQAWSVGELLRALAMTEPDFAHTIKTEGIPAIPGKAAIKRRSR